MTWIESHQEVAHHPKTRKLARKLNISQAAAIGHLHALWHWALAYADDGVLSRHTDEDVAIGALWEDDPKTFVDALAECRWVDRDGEHLALHDWDDYAGRLVERRREDARRKAEKRKTAKAVTETAATPPPAVHDPSTGHLQDGVRTQHHPTPPTEPYPTPPTPPAEPEARLLRSELFRLGHDVDDVVVVVHRFAQRLRLGKPITDPVAWASPQLEKLKAKRGSNGKPKEATFDGETYRYVEGQGWVPLAEASAP